MADVRSVPLRPLGLAELLDGAIRLVRHNARAAILLALPFAFTRIALVALVTLASVHSSDTTTLQNLTQLGATGLVGTMRTGVLAPLFTADVVGRRIDARTALRRALPTLPALVVLALVVMLAQGAGVLALLVGGIWLWGIWAVAAPALVAEQLGPWRALGRSFALVRRGFWRVWGLRTLGWLVTYVLSLLLVVPFGLLAIAVTGNNPLDPSGAVQAGLAHAPLYVLIVSLGGLIASSITGPVSSAIDTLLYADLRMRREGMDLIMHLPPAPTVPAPPPPAPLTAW